MNGSLLNLYIRNKVTKNKDPHSLKSEVHKMAKVIAAPGADPATCPFVATAMMVMEHLRERLDDADIRNVFDNIEESEYQERLEDYDHEASYYENEDAHDFSDEPQKGES